MSHRYGRLGLNAIAMLIFFPAIASGGLFYGMWEFLKTNPTIAAVVPTQFIVVVLPIVVSMALAWASWITYSTVALLTSQTHISTSLIEVQRSNLAVIDKVHNIELLVKGVPPLVERVAPLLEKLAKSTSG